MSASLAVSQVTAVPLCAPAALASGSQVEAYTVLRVLARGRHGFVYLARHAVHGTTCVLKEFMPRLHAMRLADASVSPRDAGDAIAMSVARIEFMQEATTLADIEQAGLVHVLGLIEANHTLYQVMPLYDGVTLKQLCRQRTGAPSVAWLAGIVDDLLWALQPLHARGLAHGRVQPNQVLVSAAQRATLLGFGSVARELTDPPADPWRGPQGSGVQGHLPPTPAVDLRDLATTACFAATGVAPPTTAERRASRAPSARELLSSLGDCPGDPPHLRLGLIQALDAGMAVAIRSRPQTVAEFRRLLLGEVSIQVPPVTTAPRPVSAGVATPEHVGRLQPPPAPLESADASSSEAGSAAADLNATLRVDDTSAAPGLAEAARAAAAPEVNDAEAVATSGLAFTNAVAAPIQIAPDSAELLAGVRLAPPQAADAPMHAVQLEASSPETLQGWTGSAEPGADERLVARHVAAAFTQTAPGVDSVRRGRWRLAALVVTAAFLAAGSIHWWTATVERSPSPLASRHAPGAAPVGALREQTPVTALTPIEAPVVPARSSTDTATPPPAVAATVAQADAAAQTPAAVNAALAARAPAVLPRAGPQRSAVRRAAPARAQTPRTAAPRAAAPRAAQRATPPKATAPRASQPRALSVLSAKGVSTGKRKPGLPQSPATACGKAAQFSACMRQLCAKPGHLAHSQCVKLRRKA